MRNQMSAAKVLRIPNQLIERQTNCSVVGSNNSACARTYDDVDRDIPVDEPLQHAEMTGAAQTSPA